MTEAELTAIEDRARRLRRGDLSFEAVLNDVDALVRAVRAYQGAERHETYLPITKADIEAAKGAMTPPEYKCRNCHDTGYAPPTGYCVCDFGKELQRAAKRNAFGPRYLQNAQGEPLCH